MSKGTTPLYVSSVDTINDLLDSIKFDPALPPHRRSINKAGHNVEWLRKSIKRGTVSATGPEFEKLTQLLEVPQDKVRKSEPADERKLEWLAKQSKERQAQRSQHRFRSLEEQAANRNAKGKDWTPGSFDQQQARVDSRRDPQLSRKPGSYGSHRQRVTSEAR